MVSIYDTSEPVLPKGPVYRHVPTHQGEKGIKKKVDNRKGKRSPKIL